MTILIAEDDSVTRKLLESILIRWGYVVIVTCDGNEAWKAIQDGNVPDVAILDWIMPRMDGLELCRKIRSKYFNKPIYIIMLTVKGQKNDIIEGLSNGADDYITKPFDRDELGARLHAGVRILELQMDLANHINKLEDALSKVKQLQGLIPICSYCKKIRDDRNYWQQVEEYITRHSEAKFSHGVCPECYKSIVKPDLERILAHKDNR